MELGAVLSIPYDGSPWHATIIHVYQNESIEVVWHVDGTQTKVPGNHPGVAVISRPTTPYSDHWGYVPIPKRLMGSMAAAGDSSADSSRALTSFAQPDPVVPGRTPWSLSQRFDAEQGAWVWHGRGKIP
jgi:hypothetical protein